MTKTTPSRLFNIRILIKLWVIAVGFMIGACQPQVEAPRLVITPFPTVTPGDIFEGELPSQGGAAPATIVAISREATPTPDFAGCLPLDSTETPLETTAPDNPVIAAEEIVRYLAAGGDLNRLRQTLQEDWGILGEAGYLRDDIDFTGEGVNEIVVGYALPDANATMLIIGCSEGTYQALYQSDADTPQPPQLIAFGDLNRNEINDLLFATQTCERDAQGQLISTDPEDCGYVHRLLTWQNARLRFANLLPEDVWSLTPATVSDFDNDQVSEVVLQLEDNGNSATGPLRTGVNIYDWDGQSYLLSIVQLNPPRYRIQVIQEADRQFNQRNWANAIPLYQQSLVDDPNLRYWFDDEVEVLRSYALYKLIVAQVAASDLGLTATQQQLTSLYPEPTNAPVYVRMATSFINAFSLQGNVGTACDQVSAIVEVEPLAIELMNRYGTRNPTITATELCPF
jgi:hypothetical protein